MDDLMVAVDICARKDTVIKRLVNQLFYEIINIKSAYLKVKLILKNFQSQFTDFVKQGKAHKSDLKKYMYLQTNMKFLMIPNVVYLFLHKQKIKVSRL